MNEERLRAEFEKWVKERLNLKDSNLWRIGDEYGYPIVGIHWQSWKAGYELKQREYNSNRKLARMRKEYEK